LPQPGEATRSGLAPSSSCAFSSAGLPPGRPHSDPRRNARRGRSRDRSQVGRAFPACSEEWFAEYYLIGTLLSFLIAAGAGVAVRAALGLHPLQSGNP
jgi:hypothetical protein